jgi:hypothetical protein
MGMFRKQLILETVRAAVLCSTAMPRKLFPPMVQATVLVQCRRRCALCFCLNRALRLHTLELVRTRIRDDEPVEEDFADLLREETDLAVWFSEQHGEIRARFAPFLRLA